MVRKIEAAIQAALIYWVKETYPQIMITTTANERSYREINQIGSIGITDLLLFDRRNEIVHCLCLELKKIKGKLLPSQIIWNQSFDKDWKCINFTRAVAHGFNEAKEIISGWAYSLA